MSSLSPNQPLYADPIIVLSPPTINSSVNAVGNQHLPKTRLHYIWERFIKFLNYILPSFIIFVLLVFTIYQIALAGYNCRLPDTNIGWIRAALFMNIPFVLGVLCYIVVLLVQKKSPTYSHIQLMAYNYFYILIYHAYIDRFFFNSGYQMNDVRKALNNATLLASPEQIVRLKFGKTAFNLFDRFISSISNGQRLNCLCSLWIDDTIVIDELLISRLASIINYENLISIRFDQIRFNNHLLLTKYSFKSLTHLVTSSSGEFRTLLQVIPIQLTFLHMYFDSINDIDEFIRPNMHKLRSLGIGIRCDSFYINQFILPFKNYQWTQLIQFNLNINGDVNLRFHMLQEILSPMYHLKYITLILNKALRVNDNILNGIQWRSFLSKALIFLKTFNFKFSIQPTSEQEIYMILDRFKSQWWLKDKQWFVEYDAHQNALITVPYFASKTFDNSQSYSFDLMQNPKIFYSNINTLSIDLEKDDDFKQILMSQPINQPRFNHVTKLSLNGYLTTDICDAIRNDVNLSMIQYFQFSSNVGTNEAFIELLESITNLSSIHLQYLHSLDLFNLILFPYHSLRHLVIFDYEPTTTKKLYSRICKLFPRLTHLTTDYHSRRNLRYLLKKLIHLEEITLRLSQDQHAPSQSWITQYTRWRRDSFELRVFKSANGERRLVLWINTNKNMEERRHSFKKMFHTITDIKLHSVYN
ncbi:unnamed protein product [Rotaria sp. Silwood1]|nr:unnamed protein product [Rotaria sp. Silwood1]CAF1625005.1 unnamed protein product [Rotaria sp. Silwood1]CAF3794017.1 unnamed protein product [Rotaria sp. Silwood1]CAF3811916.1 unnamed protein product [Rotaria sp. Silwood1]CAF4887217.1 unnamed protein product [Rotaria sp. Silwood1]